MFHCVAFWWHSSFYSRLIWTRHCDVVPTRAVDTISVYRGRLTTLLDRCHFSVGNLMRFCHRRYILLLCPATMGGVLSSRSILHSANGSWEVGYIWCSILVQFQCLDIDSVDAVVARRWPLSWELLVPYKSTLGYTIYPFSLYDTTLFVVYFVVGTLHSLFLLRCCTLLYLCWWIVRLVFCSVFRRCCRGNIQPTFIHSKLMTFWFSFGNWLCPFCAACLLCSCILEVDMSAGVGGRTTLSDGSVPVWLKSDGGCSTFISRRVHWYSIFCLAFSVVQALFLGWPGRSLTVDLCAFGSDLSTAFRLSTTVIL
jgi:hypothetical protein